MRAVLVLLATAGCSQLFGFESATVADGAPTDIRDDALARCEGVNDPRCTGTTPVCSDQQCRSCESNDECDSRACLPDGSCAAEADVAYVSSNGGGIDCFKTAPCGFVIDGVESGRTIISIAGTINEPTAISIVGGTFVFLGDPGAKVTRVANTNGPLFDIANPGTVVTIVGLALANNANGGAGISLTDGTLTLDRVKVTNCLGRGIDASNGTVTIRRSIIASNRLGGAALTDVLFDISNSVFAQNGTTSSTIGGIRAVSSAQGSTIQLTTIAENATDSVNLADAGVNCVGSPFAATNNIVTGLANSPALDATCTFDHSLITGFTAPGTGNLQGDAKFANRTDPSDSAYFRIKDDSAAIDQGAISTIAIDIDGQPRPSGSALDMGADEFHP